MISLTFYSAINLHLLDVITVPKKMLNQRDETPTLLDIQRFMNLCMWYDLSSQNLLAFNVSRRRFLKRAREKINFFLSQREIKVLQRFRITFTPNDKLHK